MVKKKEYCNSCKIDISNIKGAVRFRCPNCDKEEIIRCSHCRKIGSKFKCNSCGFSGPN